MHFAREDVFKQLLNERRKAQNAARSPLDLNERLSIRQHIVTINTAFGIQHVPLASNFAGKVTIQILPIVILHEVLLLADEEVDASDTELRRGTAKDVFSQVQAHDRAMNHLVNPIQRTGKQASIKGLCS